MFAQQILGRPPETVVQPEVPPVIQEIRNAQSTEANKFVEEFFRLRQGKSPSEQAELKRILLNKLSGPKYGLRGAEEMRLYQQRISGSR